VKRKLDIRHVPPFQVDISARYEQRRYACPPVSKDSPRSLRLQPLTASPTASHPVCTRPQYTPLPLPLLPTLTPSPEYSILLLGLDNAGKTTLLEQIRAHFSAHDPKLKTVPTVGQNVATVTLPDLYLKIWDVGGQHSLRKLWDSYFTSCHAIVFVIDSSDVGSATLEDLATDTGRDAEHGRLDECRLVLESVLANEDAEGVPILVLANKQDREDCVEVVRIKEGFVRKVFEGEKGANVRDSRVLPCSALTGTGVQEAVEWLCSRVRWNKEMRPPVMR
jgi:ADP-ribosylation factor related protein 1